MDNSDEVREFLTSRRAKVTPRQAGLPEAGSRRVPGLRRGEVAMLAGVSIEYYSKLERGRDRRRLGVGARRAGPGAAAGRRRAWPPVPPGPGGGRHAGRDASAPPDQPDVDPAAEPAVGPGPVHRAGAGPQRTDGPARDEPPRPGHARDGLRGAQLDWRPSTPNFARFTFLDLDAAHDFYPDWDGAADICVSILHTEAGRDPHDKALHDLVGELSTRSPEFRRRWSAHDVRQHGAGAKTFHHREVGDLRPGLRERRHDLRAGPHPDPLRRRAGLGDRRTRSTSSPPGRRAVGDDADLWTAGA